MKTITTKIKEVEDDNSPRPGRSMERAAMKKPVLLTLVIALGLLSVLFPVRQVAHAQGNTGKDFVPPLVFQGAAPAAEPIQIIQSTVDAFRAALGNPNNG